MYRFRLNTTSEDINGSVATLGCFDGLHRGHMQLFTKLNEVAIQQAYHRIAITFEPTPFEFFSDCRGEIRVPRLSLLRDKFILLKELNLVDELVVLPFNAGLAKITAEQFTQSFLYAELNVRHMVVGHDFHFGNGGLGNVGNLDQVGIKVSVLPAYMEAGLRVSSSLIRELAKNNDLVGVQTYLGRNLRYTSRVVHGNKLGRTLGVPTINLGLGRSIPAIWGIYVAKVYIEGETYNAVASVGKNPTVMPQNNGYKLEAHLLDVDLDLYGKVATIEILSFLRPELKFDDLDTLMVQMQLDLEDARDYFRKSYCV